MAKSYSSIKAFKVGKTFDDDNRKKSYKDIKSSDYDFGVDDEYIKSFYEELKTFSSNAEKDYDSIDFGTDVSGLYDKYRSQSSDLRDKASTIRGYLNSRKSDIDESAYNKFIEDIDTFDTFLDDTSGAFSKQKDFYSTFGTKYDYDAYVMNNTGGTDGDSIGARKGAYASIVERIAEIDKEIEAERGKGGILWSTMSNSQKDKAYGTRVSELEDEKNKLETELRKYEHGNKATDELYTKYSANEDWETDSKNPGYKAVSYDDVYAYLYGADADGNPTAVTSDDIRVEDPLGTYLSASEEDIYRAIDNGSAPGRDDDAVREYYKVLSDGDLGGWEHLEKEEIGLYYYMWNNGYKEEAMSYLKGMETELDRRATAKMQQGLEEANPLELVFHNVVSVPANIFGGAVSFVGNTLSVASGEEYNPYQYGYIQNYAQGVRSATANDLNNLTGNGDFLGITLGDAYQGVMSGIDSAVGAAVMGQGYTVLMGMGAASSEAQKLYEQGASQEQIIAGGLLAGAAEAVFEKVSVGYFLDDVLGSPSMNPGQWFVKALGMAGVEASEEFATTIANYITDAATRGNTSDWQKVIDKYKQYGYSDGGAVWEAIKEIGGEALHDAAIGAISGGLMGGVGSAASSAQYTSYIKQHGQKIIDEGGGVDALKSLALQTANSIGGLKGKALSKAANAISNDSKAKAVGKLSASVSAAQQQQNRSAIKDALVKRGVSKAKAENYTNILFAMNEKYFAGKEGEFTLGTEEQWQKLTGDKNIYGAMRDIVTDEMVASIKNRGARYGAALRGVRMDDEGKLNESDVNAYQERMIAKITGGGLAGNTKNNLDVSLDGKTVIDGIDEEITNWEFTDSEDGSLKIKANGDKVADIGSASFGDVSEAYAVSAIVDMGVGAEDANALFGMLSDKGEGAGKAFANGISLAFKYGRYLYSPSKLANIAGITKEQARKAYEIGRRSRDKGTKAAQSQLNAIAESNTAEGKTASTKGSVVFEGAIADENGNLAAGEDSLTDIQKASVNGLKLIAELSPINFHIFQSTKDGETYSYVKQNGEKTHANGWYRVGTNDIYIDLNAGNLGEGTMMYTAAHEISHFIKEYSPQKWDKVAEYIMNEYCSRYGGKVDTLLLRHTASVKNRPGSKNRTQQSIEDEAFEDLVCDSLSKMLIDGTVVQAMANIKQKDKGIWNTIKNAVMKLLEKWSAVIDQYKGRTPDAEEAIYFTETSKAFKDLKAMLTDAFVDAGETYSKVGNIKQSKGDVLSERDTAEESKAIEAFGDDLGTVERNANGDMLIATNKDSSTVVYSERTWNDGGKDKFIALMTTLGHGEQAQEYAKYLDDALDYLHELAVGYEILGQHLDATITTDIKNGKQVLSSIVNNGEYPVNIDLALICKKRVAYMRLMAKMIEDGVFGDVKYDGDAIAEVNAILRKNGFETACLGCFVESRRLQFQTWAETIVQEWNEAVEARNKHAHYFRFADGKAALTEEDIKTLDSELASGGKKNDKGNLNLGQGSVADKMGRLLDKVPSLARKLTVDDLLTPQGLTALRATDGNLFSLVKQRYGAASPKIVQDYNPYASEIADLTFKYVKDITGNAVKGAQDYIKVAKAEVGVSPKKQKGEPKEDFAKRKAEYDTKVEALAMRKYLYSIGGARIQSFSDFMIENVFDYLQIFADLTAKELPMHGYTKEIAALRLFGMTGAKWNGSLIAHVEKSMGKEYAGLLPASEAKNGNGILVKVDGKDYCIGFDDFARNKATNGGSFIQSIGMKDIIALMYDPRYSPYVGNITIGVSDKQITAMLDSPLFRMVIPYHASGMLPQFAQLVGVDMYNDYTNYQNTTVKEIRLVDDANYTVKIGDNGKPKLVKNADGKDVGINTHYAFNEMLQKYGDARKTCQDYLAWCRNEHPIYDKGKLVGYTTFSPKFSDSPTGVDFTKHRNYYKLIEDFNTYDNITEKASQQGAVTMTFPSVENRLTVDQKAAYEKALRDTGIFTDADIKKYLDKADMTFEDIVRAEVGNRKAYNDAQEPKFNSTVKEVEDYLLNAKDANGNYKFRRDAIADTASDYIEAKNKGISLKPATGSYLDEVAKFGVENGWDKLSDRSTIRSFDHSDEAIARNVETVAVMDSVHDVPEDALGDSGKPVKEIYQEFFTKWGGELFSEELGTIDVKTSSIRSERRHGSTAEKIAAIEAIPAVISNGKVIFAGEKDNGRILRIVVCAPIKIADKPYYMGVMVQRDLQHQRLYLHDVVIEKETPTSSLDDLHTTGSSEENERLFVTTILQQALKVKYEHRNEPKVKEKNSDRSTAYMQVVARAKEYFGTTTDFEEAGFVLPSGEMLRFTDDNHSGERAYDHRAIGLAYGVDVDLSVNHGYNEASGKHLNEFVEDGGIRFFPGNLENDMDAGMQLSKSKPITKEQEQTIRDFIEWKKQREENYNPSDDEFSLYRGSLALHIDFGVAENSSSFAKRGGANSLSYEGGQINADRIIADIRHYYRTGETRQQSLVAQFLYSDRVTDKNTLDFLNKQLDSGEVTKVYRAMQAQPVDENGNVIKAAVMRVVSYSPLRVEAKTFGKDGKVAVYPAKLFSPMAGMVNGKWSKNIELNEWEETTFDLAGATTVIDKKTGMPKIDNDKKNASYGEIAYYYGLVKGGIDDDGKKLTDVPARYNPYIHTSLSALNDQFSSANKRPELVTVECIIPNSELTSGFRAEGAKDRVGAMSWHSGPTSSRLAKVGKARTVILTRYDMPVRVLPDSEVAKAVAEYIGDTKNIAIQGSTVTPSLSRELMNLGISVLNEEEWSRYSDEFPAKTFGNKGADGVLYQDRDTEPISNRALLANALESTIDTSTQEGQNELRKLNEYKAMVGTLDELNAKLTELRSGLFSKGTTGTERKKMQEGAIKIANRISIYDKKLLTLEASKPLKKVLDREKAEAVKRQKKKDADALKSYRDRAEAKLKQQSEHYQESRKKAVDNRNKTAIRRKIKGVVKELDKLLNRGTKERNVKVDMQETVESALKLANVIFNDEISNEDIVRMGSTIATDEEMQLLDTYKAILDYRDSHPVDENWDKNKKKIQDLNRQLADLFARERARLNRAKISSAIDELAKAYAGLKNSNEGYVNFAYNDETYGRLTALSETLKGVIVRDMTREQLEEVYDAFYMIKHMVSVSNSLFRMGKEVDLAKSVDTVQQEILAHLKEKKDPNALVSKIASLMGDFSWNELKPSEAFERLGSELFSELFWDAIKAEGVWATDIQEAKQFLDAKRSEYGYKSWDMESATTFTMPDGKEFKLTLQDMMSIYAYSKRDQAYDHMTIGGFQFAEHSEYKDGKTKRIHLTGDLYVTDLPTIGKIIAELEKTHDGKVIKYVDEVQDYLTKMGDKGNEVSRVMYGIDIFGETAYFPLMSAKDYRSSVEEALNNTQTMVSLKNTGMTKQTVPHANNPIILQGFDSVVEGHIDKMAKYHAFVLPIENLRRVFDSASFDEGTNGYISTKAIINKVFGKSAERYFDQYITDLNGGTLDSGAESPTMQMFSKFKGTAVSASLSVVIQQPFAVTRAMAVINPKHFVLGKVEKPEGMKLYEEIKKYAPVAIIKEMGGFDVGSSRTAREYLGTRTDKGLKRAVDEVNEKAMWGAQKADELGWGLIWKAVKREVLAQGKYEYGTKEYFDACGERFTEVIVRTQVYDSVNSRSGYMRSKSELVKFATSFMGEPTTIVNMVYSAMLKVARAKSKAERKQAVKGLLRTTGTLVASTVLTAMAKSIIYAMRDDDDEEAFLERWAAHFGDNMLSDINPFSMLPFTRDIVSMIEGWDVERPDMTLFANIITSAKRLMTNGATIKEIKAFVGDVCNAFGIPAKNIMRDVEALFNLLKDIFTGNIV